MLLCAVLAATASLVLYQGTASLFDLVFASWLRAGESVCDIPPIYVILLYAGSCLVAGLCCAAAGKSLLQLQPAEVLRRNV
jgi:hypothetical protein